MADYWKSQDRKYCDFCKCWIADNRPSIEFHEKGRRHQENVKKRIRNISKNSARSQLEAEKVDATLKQMEAAALEAYRKDVENNADLTSAAINKKLREDTSSSSASSSQKVWHEVKAPDGSMYYWNTTTNETVHEAPKEGYLSLAEQEQQKQLEKSSEWKTFQKLQQRDALLRKQEEEKEEAEERARLAREKLKERRVADSPEPVVTYGPILDPGPTNPYGKWEVVKERPQVDLQLPEQSNYFEPPVEYVPEPIVKEFKEKTIEKLDAVGETSFKKRKIAVNTKRNVRQRLDND